MSATWDDCAFRCPNCLLGWVTWEGLDEHCRRVHPSMNFAHPSFGHNGGDA